MVLHSLVFFRSLLSFENLKLLVRIIIVILVVVARNAVVKVIQVS